MPRKHTRNNQTLQFNLALSYGGRDEIIRAVKDLTQAGKKQEHLIRKIFLPICYRHC